VVVELDASPSLPDSRQLYGMKMYDSRPTVLQYILKFKLNLTLRSALIQKVVYFSLVMDEMSDSD